MKLPNINYKWNAKDLAMGDANAPVKLAQQKAQNLQAQAGADAKWAGAANANSNTARAWGTLYENVGQMPDDMANVAAKYDSARADAKITSHMTEFSKKFDRKDKPFFSPEELRAEGLEFEPEAKDIDGKTYTRTEIPKHEVYAQAYNKYANDSKKEAQNEFGWLSYSDQWEQKTDMTIAQGTADANQKSGKMAWDFLVNQSDTQVKMLADNGEYGAALKTLEGCIEGNAVCNQKRLAVKIQRDTGMAQDAMISGDVKAMEHQRALIASGNTMIPKEQSLGLINKLNREIKRVSDENETEALSNFANSWSEQKEGQPWDKQLQDAQNIPDAKRRKAVQTELKNRMAFDKATRLDGEREKYNERVQAIYADPSQPIPPDVVDGKDRQSLESLRTGLLNNKMATNPAAYTDLVDLMSNPARSKELADTNISKKYGKNIKWTELKPFIEKQKKAPEGVMTNAAMVKTRILRALSIEKPAKNQDRYDTMTYIVNNQILNREAQGEAVTEQMINEIVSDTQKAQTKEGRIWGTNDYDISDVDDKDLEKYGTPLSAQGYNTTYENINTLKSVNIPVDYQAEVLKNMKDRGIPFTKDNLNKAYIITKGGK